MYNYIIFFYLIGIFIMGIFAGKFVKGFEDYAIAGGNFGFIILIGTIIATQWGGGSFLGIAGFGYEHLYRGVWYALSAIPRFLIWALFLSVIIRKVQPYTISEWFAIRYNKETGMLVSVINLIIGIGLLGAQFVAFGNVVNTFMNADLTLSIIIGALIVGIYTIAGGLFAVALTDVIQFVIAFAASLGVLSACISKVGTYSNLRQVLPAEYFNPTQPYGWFFMITIFMLWMADLPMQYVIQRISSAKSMKVAYWGAISGVLSFALLGYISPSIGAYAKVLLPNLARPDLAYPSLLKEVLPPSLAAFAASGLLAAIMSTGDSYLLAPATLVANDFFRVVKPEASAKESLNVARIFTVVYILLGLWVALIFKVILQLSMTFLGIGMAMLPAFIASTCWKGASSKGAFWSLAIGCGINAIIIKYPPLFLTGLDSSLRGWVGFFIALIILVGLSLTQPEKSLKSTTEDLLSKLTV